MYMPQVLLLCPQREYADPDWLREKPKRRYSMEERALRAGREIAAEIFGVNGTECAILYSSMQIESVMRRNKKAATKKRLNTVLKRSYDAYKAAIELLVRRDYAVARDTVEPFTNGEVPSVWICFSPEEVAERVTLIYESLSASPYPYDAFVVGGREHVGTVQFWLDR
jgi:hypothetical protein